MTTGRVRVVLVAGATGLVGREIVAMLLAERTVEAVHCVGRRPLALKHPKLQDHVVDFAKLPALPKVDECYIALGTTIKVAGSQAAFKAIDLDAVVAVAQAAKSAGATKVRKEPYLSLIRGCLSSAVIPASS